MWSLTFLQGFALYIFVSSTLVFLVDHFPPRFVVGNLNERTDFNRAPLRRFIRSTNITRLPIPTFQNDTAFIFSLLVVPLSTHLMLCDDAFHMIVNVYT